MYGHSFLLTPIGASAVLLLMHMTLESDTGLSASCPKLPPAQSTKKGLGCLAELLLNLEMKSLSYCFKTSAVDDSKDFPIVLPAQCSNCPWCSDRS